MPNSGRILQPNDPNEIEELAVFEDLREFGFFEIHGVYSVSTVEVFPSYPFCDG